MTHSADALAEELHATAAALQTYLAEALQDDTSVLADALRKFPGMFDDIAMRMAMGNATSTPKLAPTQFAEFLAAWPQRRLPQ